MLEIEVMMLIEQLAACMAGSVLLKDQSRNLATGREQM
jgi:hypothetical protein